MLSADPETGQIQALADQNKALQAQLQAQQAIIQSLESRLDALEKASSKPDAPLSDGTASAPASDARALPSNADQTIRLSADVGLAFFYTGQDGSYPQGEFRVDDARIFLDASVWKNVYFHGEIDPTTREASDTTTRFGELYADAENVSGSLWGADNALSVKFGRMYAPYGEEYAVRGVMDNPLVSHSLSDLWAMDAGLEAYGSSSGFSYAAAVLDGGLDIVQSGHTDKAVAARIGYDFSNGLHLSASAFRTGRLSATDDSLSSMWFANGFFRAIGPAGTVRTYWADLAEVDAAYRWHTGHIGAFVGAIHFDDDSAASNDARHMTYASVEGVQTLAGGLYGAIRYSQIRAPGGYPIAGQAYAGEYFFGNGDFATSLSRMSVGLGYRFGVPLVLKLEYSPEWGHDLDGEDRNEEDMFSTELALHF